AGASRLISGNLPAHRESEAAIAHFFGTEDAVLWSSGYAANVGVLQGLAGPEDVIFSDALNHASLIDGCRLSRARIHVFPHRDLDALSSLLRQHRSAARRALVVTDSVFSMQGDLAPLGELRALCDEHRAALVVDEAHAVGVLGPAGRGLAASMGIVPDILVGTAGKALGLAGAFVAGSSVACQVLRGRSRSFVFSTGVLPILGPAIVAALELAACADDRRARLLALS